MERSFSVHALVFSTLLVGGCQHSSAPPGVSSAGAAIIERPASLEHVALRRPSRGAAPLSLTASDGTGLRLASLHARSIAEDPLGFTELHLAFENPEDRTMEGTFRIALPQGASVSRFAMRIDGRWQEGEVVEKQRARASYEDFLHRKQDPALLEQSAGNEFSARVFPIPPRAKKELIVSYSQELAAGAPFVVPLAGLPEVPSIDLAVSAPDGRSLASFQRASFTPEQDFVVPPATLGKRDAIRSGDLALVRVAPITASQPDPLTSAVVLVDTSASRTLSFDDDLELLRKLAARVATEGGPEASLSVIAFDQTREVVFEGAARAFGDAALARLRERGALGASDFEGALAFAAEAAKRRGARRLVLLSDGVATAKETDLVKLGPTLDLVNRAGIERMDAVMGSGVRDDRGLGHLVRRAFRRDGVVVDGAFAFDAIAWRLGQKTQSNVPVKIDGARWTYPTTLDGMQSGDEALVYAELPASAPLRVTVGGRALSPAVATVDKPLLERAWAKAKIANLLESPNPAPELRQQIVALSTAYRVLSPYTAMLVLETERDYARFGLDRAATVNVMTIADGKLVVRAPTRGAIRDGAGAPARAIDAPDEPGDPSRADARLEPPGAHAGLSDDPMSARGSMWGTDIGDAFGAGGLGLSEVGEGGGGRGEGIGLGRIGTLGQGGGTARTRAAATRPSAPITPSIRQSVPIVSGRVPPEVIQRIVRQNFGRFRLCYENGLRANRTLQGRVLVRFTIALDGSVASVADGGSDLPSPAVVACVTRSFRNLSFPAPEGGTVTVVYPLVFSPNQEAAPSPAPPVGPPAEPREPAVDRAEPYTGRMKPIMDLIASGATTDALRAARVWHEDAPGDVMALIALGEALEATGDRVRAARAYGSIVDLFPNRADMRRYAGQRLERLSKDRAALDLAIDSFEKARGDRPDHPSSHRLLAFALVRRGEYEKAFGVIADGIARRYPSGRFVGVQRILAEDAGLIAAAWIRSAPKERAAIEARLREVGGVEENAPSLRFVLSWETDANDVDFHVHDARGGHASYRNPILPSGGELYADVTTGYGPECFTIRAAPGQRAGEYALRAHYYARGPMGFGMGKLEIIEHDGKGGLTFDERPFVVMADRAFVDLGTAK